jgi:hypothetical protein
MAIYRSVQMTFWTDAKVVDNFTPEDRYFYLYLLTNPHTNLCGCYEISFKQMSDETGYTKEVVERLLDRMENVHDVIRYSKITKELLVINWSKFNWTTSKDFKKPLLKELQEVKDTDFKGYLVNLLEEGHDGVMTVLSRSNDRPMTTVTVTDNNKHITLSKDDDVESKLNNLITINNRFIPPTVEEVEAYCQERDNEVDAEQFVDFYESKGWMVGKNKMKNWKASVRTWERDTSKGKAKREQEKQDREDEARGIEHIDDWAKVDKYGNYKP